MLNERVCAHVPRRDAFNRKSLRADILTPPPTWFNHTALFLTGRTPAL
jgi:hypothetical protein